MIFKAHDINQLENIFISGWYIDKFLCQEILQEIEKKKILLVSNQYPNKNYSAVYLNKLSKNLNDRYIDSLSNLKKLYCQQYDFLKILNRIELTSLKDKKEIFPVIKLQRYKPHEYYSVLHCENDAGNDEVIKRALVFMTYLNDIEQGGETHFPAQNLKIKPEQGLTLFWPPYWTHPHIGIETNSVKYILTGWYEFI